MFDKNKVKKNLKESEYSKLDSDIEKSILESIEDDFDIEDDSITENVEPIEDDMPISEEGDEDVVMEDEELNINSDTSDEDLPIDLPEAESDEDFDMEDDSITEEENVEPDGDEDLDFDIEDDTIDEIAIEDQDPEMIVDSEEPDGDEDLDIDLSDDTISEDEEIAPEEDLMEDEDCEDSEEKILEDLQKIEERKMKLEAAKAEVDSTDKDALISEVKKHKAALRNLATKYVALQEAYKTQTAKRKKLTEAAQKSIKTNASLKLENFKAIKLLALFSNSDLKSATKMKIVEAFDNCKDEKAATTLYNTVVRKIKESAKSDSKLNQIVQNKKGTQKVVKESASVITGDKRSVEEMRNDYMMGIDDAYESHFYKRGK